MTSKKALLIGINYLGTPSQLNGCINDVTNLRNFLLQNLGYNASDITLMTDSTALKPTRSNMEAQLQALVANAEPGDFILLHYSGHGSRSRDLSGDETDGIDEVLVPLDYETAGMISDDWLLDNVLRRVPVGVTMRIFMDCCHSGTICDLKHNYKSACRLKAGNVQVGMPFVYRDWTEQYVVSSERSLNLTSNICMYSAALDPEYAEDASIGNQGQGAFTFCLLETLRNNVTALRSGTLRLRNVLKEVNCRLDLGGYASQQCQLSVTDRTLFESIFQL
jgi:hypothetical protein